MSLTPITEKYDYERLRVERDVGAQDSLLYSAAFFST